MSLQNTLSAALIAFKTTGAASAVQSKAAVFRGPVSTETVTLDNPITAGNTILVFVGSSDTVAVPFIPTLSDDGANVYTQLATVLSSGAAGNGRLTVFVCIGAVAATNITSALGSQMCSVSVIEYPNIWAVDAYSTVGCSAVDTPVALPAVTTTVADDLLVVGCLDASSNAATLTASPIGLTLRGSTAGALGAPQTTAYFDGGPVAIGTYTYTLTAIGNPVIPANGLTDHGATLMQPLGWPAYHCPTAPCINADFSNSVQLYLRNKRLWFLSDALTQTTPNTASAVTGLDVGRLWYDPGLSSFAPYPGEPTAGLCGGSALINPDTLITAFGAGPLFVVSTDLNTGFWGSPSSTGDTSSNLFQPGPLLAVTSTGKILVCYSNSSWNTCVQEYDPGTDTWGTPVRVDTSSAQTVPTAMVIDENDTLHIVYGEGVWPGSGWAGAFWYVQLTAGAPNTPIALPAMPRGPGLLSLISTNKTLVMPFMGSDGSAASMVTVKPYTSSTPTLASGLLVTGQPALNAGSPPSTAITSYCDGTTCTIMWVANVYLSLSQITYVKYHGTESLPIGPPQLLHDEVLYPSPMGPAAGGNYPNIQGLSNPIPYGPGYLVLLSMEATMMPNNNWALGGAAFFFQPGCQTGGALPQNRFT